MQLTFSDPLIWSTIFNSKSLPLVGRENEMHIIRFFLSTVLNDDPAGARAMIISGEMGIGKSRLLAETYAEAQELGFRILEGHIYEAESLFPFFPFIEALRPLLHTLSTQQLQHYFGLTTNRKTGESGTVSDTDMQETYAISFSGELLVTALAQLFPELPRQLNIHIIPEILTLEQQKFRLFDAIATFLERVASQQPILLGIDNLQWADSASLELTMYLTTRLHKSRVALLGAMRPQNISHKHESTMDTADSAAAVIKILTELTRQKLLIFLPLAPLEAPAASKHLHQLLPGSYAEPLKEALLVRAEGNPFFLEELIRTLTLNHQIVQQQDTWDAATASAMDLPNNITLAVKQRLQELSQACQDVLRTASLFGRIFPLEALIYVLKDMEERQLLSAIDEAVQTKVILLVTASSDEKGHGGGPTHSSSLSDIRLTIPTYMFSHGIVQEVLQADFPAHRARLLHREIGIALEATYIYDTAMYAAELARHAMLGGNKSAALRYSLRAGEYAIQHLAYREAIKHFQLVLKLLVVGETLPDAPARAELATTIGDLLFKLGEFGQAEQTLQAALIEIKQSPTSATALTLSQIHRHLADIYRIQGKFDQAINHLQAAFAAFPVQESEKEVGRLEEQSASVEPAYIPWFDESMAVIKKQDYPFERGSIEERILLLQAQATLDIFLNRVAAAEKTLWQSYQLALEIDDRGSQAFALHFTGYLRGWGERIQEAIRFQEQALELYIAIGDPLRAVLGEQVLGSIYQVLGQVEQGLRYTQRGLARAQQYGILMHQGWLHWNLSITAMAHGNWSQCQFYLQEAEATQAPRLTPIILQTRAQLAFRQGDWQQAERCFNESIQAALRTEWYQGVIALYGHFLAVTGRSEAARIQLDKAAAYPEPPGYAGDFYIPFLAEGYLHLGAHQQAISYIERIRTLRGFLYFGHAIDRILGIVAAQSSDWETAEQSFADGLAVCRQANNAPEEASILYEQARVLLMKSRTQAQALSLKNVQPLCTQARQIFQQYNMQRYVVLLDTFQAGIVELEQQNQEKMPYKAVPQGQELLATGYHLDISLTQREREVLQLVAEGHTDREVAETLIISPRTVNRHLSNILTKLDVPGRAAAVAYAIRQGLA